MLLNINPLSLCISIFFYEKVSGRVEGFICFISFNRALLNTHKSRKPPFHFKPQGSSSRGVSTTELAVEAFPMLKPPFKNLKHKQMIKQNPMVLDKLLTEAGGGRKEQ